MVVDDIVVDRYKAVAQSVDAAEVHVSDELVVVVVVEVVVDTDTVGQVSE